MDENADGGVVTAVTTENADEITVDDERFEVADGNLKLKDGLNDGMGLDFESDTSPIEVTITATAAGDNATHTVTVSINDVNDAPEITVAAATVPEAEAAGVSPDLTVSEGSDGSVPGGVVAHIALSDQDAGDTHTLTVSDDRFETIEAFGQWWLKLKAGAELDYETEPTVMVTVTVTDDGEPAMSASAEVTIMVTDANDAPTIAVADGETPDGMPASSTVDENVAGAILGAITLSDEDEGQMHTLSTSDDRFVTKQDDEGGWWLALADGESLDHEAEDGSVMVTVTVTDDGDPAMSASTDVTITVNDVNEAPTVTGEQGNVFAEAGKTLSHKVDVMALFSDPDAGDSIESWTLSGNPHWLELVVEYGEDDDGNETVTGILQGTPPTTGSESDAAHEVTITASDGDGESASVSFHVVVDDGNDAPTNINLIDDGQSVIEVEVTEGDASGVVLGEITVDDIDSPHHPYGQHLITVDDDRFEIREAEGKHWLALKEGESLDYEREGGEVLVTLRAIDRNGEKDDEGDYKGHRSAPVTFAVVIDDQNDAPRTGTIGNWWVTVDEDLDAEDVDAGDWLDFSLETSGSFAAFRDADRDTLTYSISMNRGNWLQIDEETGQITNVEGRLPTRGVYRVTITATDEDGQSTTGAFNLNVALSDEAADGTLTGENDVPEVRDVSEPEYVEGSGDKRVATFRVVDEDQDIPDHQFALKDVKITAIVNADNPADLNNAYLIDENGDEDDDTDDDGIINVGDRAGERVTPRKLWTTKDGSPDGDATEVGDMSYGSGYAAALQLSDPIPSSSAWTYHIEAVDTDPNPRWDTTWLLNYENVSELAITIEARDGVETVTDAKEVQVNISDREEAPSAPSASPRGSLVLTSDLQVEQHADNVRLLYIKLEDLWSDEDGDLGSKEEDFGASSNVPWINILHGPAKWDDIKEELGGEWPTSDLSDGSFDHDGNADTDGVDVRIISDANSEGAPEDSDIVVIVAIDRTERNNQSDKGGGIATFTLTATDNDDNTGSRTYDVGLNIIDENLSVEAGAVTISGSAREGSTLRANFNDNDDPDLAGSATPAAVLYTWYRVDVNDEGDPTGDPVVIVQSSSNTYTPVQRDVGKFIGVVVRYYEVDPSTGTDTLLDATDDNQLFANAIATVTLDSLRNDAEADAPTKDAKAAITSRAVSETPDRGAADITILANEDKLTVNNAAVRIVDGDYPFAGAESATVVPYSESTVDDTVIPSISVSFEVSDNGRGGWTAVDKDDVEFDSTTDTTSLDLDDGKGKYYRAVATYDADTGDDSAKERVVSDPIRVADVRDDDSAAPTPRPSITGSPNPNGTLKVDAGSATVSVQWQIKSGTKWVDIPGATGDLRLTQEHAEDSVRAVVSYHSRDPDNPGATVVVVATEDGTTDLDSDGNTTGDSEILIGGERSNVRPAKVDDYEIEASVGGTGHGIIKLFAPAGHNATIEHTVPLGNLFQDPDTPSFLVSYAAADNQTDPNLSTNSGADGGSTYVYEHHGGVLIFEAKSGKLTYLSDQYQGHDNNPADGAGNMITLEVTAADPGPTGANTGGNADIVLRINVAPTDITFRENWEDGERDTPADRTDDRNDANNEELETANFVTAYGPGALPQIKITENDFEGGTRYMGPGDPKQDPLAILDVQDDNLSGSVTARGHKFGAHEITVTGDDRFVISKTGGDDPDRDRDGDGSTWELHAVKGATFDYETDDADGNPRNGIQIVLTFSATDGGGLSTPTPNSPTAIWQGIPASALHQPIQLLVTIENADQSDERDPPRTPDTETPGLKDNEDNDRDDTRDDDSESSGDHDDDTDGGAPPPPPGMSLGGIIEDFTDNMDHGEIDLLEDYLLTIDDGLDIA